MHLGLTLSTTDGRTHEVTVDVAGAHDGRCLADALLEALHLDPTSEVWAGEEVVDEQMTVGSPPLLHGAHLLIRPAGHRPTGRARGSPLRLAVVGGPDAGHDIALTHGSWTVGRSPSCDLTLDDPSLSRTHLVVEVGSSGVHVRPASTTNPTRLDDHDLDDASETLTAGSVLTAGAHRLAVRGTHGRRLTVVPTGDGTLRVSTQPLPAPPEPARAVAFPAEPRAPRARRLPWVMLVAPLPLAGAMAYLFGPRMLLLALLSPVMMLGTHLSDRIGSRADARRERADWAAASRRARVRLEAALQDETSRLERSSPDPYELRLVAAGPGTRLWERRRDHAGACLVRVGIGETAAHLQVTAPGADATHPRLTGVPVALDLDEHPVLGVEGDPAEVARVARWVVGQLLVLHPPSEVEALVLGRVGWMGGLVRAPHVSSAGADGLHSLAEEVRRRDPRSTHDLTLVVVDDPGPWRRSEAWRTVVDDGPAVGVRVLLAPTGGGELPHECRTVLTLREGRGVVRGPGRHDAVVADGVDLSWAEEVGRALAPLRDAAPGRRRSRLPAVVALTDVADVPTDPGALLERWRAPSSGLAAVLGAGEGGPLTVDLVTDGPHVLVGGTTGSGKSELLQSWICSLALAHGPDRLTFVLVDYKGGAALAACAQLPHTVGVLTDLDPDGAQRALASLGAELRRREALLAELGAADITAYREAGGTLPRLVVVVDEFRVLAQEQPDVLSGMVRLAAVGRSLGIHLVLATQRPAGIITPEIKANVNLRISLRVRDRVDSDDVIGCADAASIPEGMPGRGLLRTGDGPPTVVQAAYVGGRGGGGDHLTVRGEGGELLWSRADPVPAGAGSDLSEAVDIACQAWESTGALPPHRPWLPPLPAVVDTVPSAPPDVVVWGLTDHPDEQRQDPLTWALGDGHLLVAGGPRTGRTTALHSLVSRMGSALRSHVVVHLVAPPSPATDRARAQPHVASVVDPGDRSTTRRLVSRLREDIDLRRDALRASGRPGYEQWWADWRRGEADRPPPVLVVAVDGWSLVARAPDQPDVESADALESVARDGASLGIRLVVTGGRELSSGRLGSLARRRLVLHLPDRGDVLAAGAPPSLVPAGAVPGRGALLPDGVLAQVALPVPAGRPSTDSCDPWRWRVVDLPASVALDDLPHAEGLVLGHSGDPDRPVLVEVDGGPWVAVGPGRSGRTTALELLGEQLAKGGRPVLEVSSLATRLVASSLAVIGPEEVDPFVRAVQSHEDLVVLVDDLDTLDETPLDPVLRSYASHCARSGDVLLAASSSTAASSFRGLTATMCRSRRGLLLQPQARSDGDVLGVRVSASPRVPGRGYLVDRGVATEVQVALPARAAGQSPAATQPR